MSLTAIKQDSTDLIYLIKNEPKVLLCFITRATEHASNEQKERNLDNEREKWTAETVNGKKENDRLQWQLRYFFSDNTGSPE